MTQVANLVVKMSGDSSSLSKAASRGKRALMDLGRAGKQLALIGGASALAAVAGLGALGKAAADNIDRVSKLGQNLGITAREVQRFELIADLTGVGMDQMAKGMQRLQRETGKLQIGRASKEVKEAFAQLGLGVEQLRGLKSDELLATVVTALQGVSNDSERAALGFILMGKAAATMEPVIADAANIMRETHGFMADLGLGLGESAAETERLNDNFTKLAWIGTALRDQVFQELAPILADHAQKLIDMASAALRAAGGGEALAKAIGGSLVAGITKAIRWLREMWDVVVAIGRVIGIVIDAIQGVGRVGAAVAAAGAAVFRGEFSGAARILSEDLGDVFSGDEETKQEQKKHTELLKQIAENAGAAFG